jgi:2-polyprenyl-6-methoxyphenol hydroxylase-like FAD-dependent oxidoreductase
MSDALIVGAGPVGLAAAVFLSRWGASFRIIDQLERPSGLSRALAVNPRTLELLEPTGITGKMLELGLPIRAMRIYRSRKQVGELRFSSLHHRYPFMLALSQAVTERLLAQALQDLGRTVERGCCLTDCRPSAGRMDVRLRTSQGIEAAGYSLVLAIDGAKSQVRTSLGLSFQGSSFPAPWHLADVPLETDLAQDCGHVFLLDQGRFLFLVRVVADKRREVRDRPLWRVIGNFPKPLAELPEVRGIGAPVWQSDFRISHRIDVQLRQGQTFFAGDAAHVHSPIGARGMNLGIEDAWLFSELWRTNHLERYAPTRKAVDQEVVRRVERFSRLMQGESLLRRELRDLVLPYVIGLPFVSRRLVGLVAGVDHALSDA